MRIKLLTLSIGSAPKNRKIWEEKKSRLLVVSGILLLVLGVSLCGYSLYTIQEHGQMLECTDLTLEEFYANEGALKWWKTTFDTVFCPLSISFVVLGFTALLYQHMLNSSIRKLEQKEFKSTRLPPYLTLNDLLVQTIVKEKPATTKKLTKLIQQKFDYSDEEILKQMSILQNKGKVLLKKKSIGVPNFFIYLLSGKTRWYWITLLSLFVATLIIWQIPEGTYPLVIVRYALGYGFVLFFPGYILINALFPISLDTAERIGLSIGASIGLVCLDAFFLNCILQRLDFCVIVLSLWMFILLFATIGLIRGYFANVQISL